MNRIIEERDDMAARLEKGDELGRCMRDGIEVLERSETKLARMLEMPHDGSKVPADAKIQNGRILVTDETGKVASDERLVSVAKSDEQEKDRLRQMNSRLSIEVRDLRFLLNQVPYWIRSLFNANNQSLRNERAERRRRRMGVWRVQARSGYADQLR
jgi:hypothetical protein